MKDLEDVDMDIVVNEGVVVDELTLLNGSWINVFEYKNSLFYIDEVQMLGPFEDWDEIDKMLEKVINHVDRDPDNRVMYHMRAKRRK